MTTEEGVTYRHMRDICQKCVILNIGLGVINTFRLSKRKQNEQHSLSSFRWDNFIGSHVGIRKSYQFLWIIGTEFEQIGYLN